MGVQIPMRRGNFLGEGHVRVVLELCAVIVYRVETEFRLQSVLDIHGINKTLGHNCADIIAFHRMIW